jgi:hypothetical protein
MGLPKPGVNGSVAIATVSAKLAEIAVLGPVTSSALRALTSRSERSDYKNVRESKDVKDFSKKIPERGPGKRAAAR